MLEMKDDGGPEEDGSLALRAGWWARVPGGPEAARRWRPLQVFPTTSLMAMVRWGIYSPPWLDQSDAEAAAPDIFHAGPAWYNIEYKIDALPLRRMCAGAPPGMPTHVWLMLDGANYSVRVFVNGHAMHGGAGEGLLRRVYDGGNLRWRRAAFEPKGMWTVRALDITPHVRLPTEDDEGKEEEDRNCVRIEVDAVDHYGCVDSGGQGGDHQVAKDVSAQFVEGWDWMVPVHDRNTGVWDDVRLLVTGPIRMQDLHVCTSVAPDASADSVSVCASIAVTLVNAGSRAYEVELEADVGRSMEDAGMDGWTDVCAPPTACTVRVGAGEAETVSLPTIAFRTSDVWWPVGMGAQPLFRATVTASVDGGWTRVESHAISSTFGVRTVTSAIDEATGGRAFAVNGERVFIRGANYTCSCGWLRPSRSRWAAEVAMLARCGVNMLRLWGGSNLARPGLLRECDRRGILVWFEFWITGDTNGRGLPPTDADWPLDHRLFIENALGMAVWARNHPCVALWCGGNEQRPSADIDGALRAHLDGVGAITDAGDARSYVSGSLWEGFGSGDGAFSDGPYGIQRPEDFYPAAAAAADDDDDIDGRTVRAAALPYPYAFDPEVGSVGLPALASLLRIFPTDAGGGRTPPRVEVSASGAVSEACSPAWAAHCYIPFSNGREDLVRAYGEWGEGDLAAFCERAQIVQYTQYRSLFEAFGSGMWTRYTGVLMWKCNNPWTGLRGALYGYDLLPNAGLFGAARALSEPRHVQLNLRDLGVELVNTSRAPVAARAARVEAVRYALDGAETGRARLELGEPVPPMGMRRLGRLPWADEGSAVRFVELVAEGCADRPFRSRNVYWLPSTAGDFRGLNALPRAEVDARACRCGAADGPVRVSLQLSPASPGRIAFFVRVTLVATATGEPVAGAVYSENCVTFFAGGAGEEVDIEMAVDPLEEGGEEKEEGHGPGVDGGGVSVHVEGFNCTSHMVPVERCGGDGGRCVV